MSKPASALIRIDPERADAHEQAGVGRRLDRLLVQAVSMSNSVVPVAASRSLLV